LFLGRYHAACGALCLGFAILNQTMFNPRAYLAYFNIIIKD
jgi:hypothetical protein